MAQSQPSTPWSRGEEGSGYESLLLALCKVPTQGLYISFYSISSPSPAP